MISSCLLLFFICSLSSPLFILLLLSLSSFYSHHFFPLLLSLLFHFSPHSSPSIATPISFSIPTPSFFLTLLPLFTNFFFLVVPVVFNQTEYTVTEDNGTILICVQLFGNLERLVRVNISTSSQGNVTYVSGFGSSRANIIGQALHKTTPTFEVPCFLWIYKESLHWRNDLVN